ncbi:GGDEF domain-containing protein [Clostridium thermosuccinogenes]|uniref:GGDEF domain-containing protein n=1 Tax=Clostridium thermosuccinogenes TaxID=84032 RepID=A0A2K2F8Y4_9CLOT|nr:GGDEF domain-containing protein [Pseudoclostridium thermosuccinogenes]PNT95240.1 GGDEF domain-containing protein [Pseudoclostridium thermosuccinogenes]PNT96152.1 GGDEF domain-containing protein [Pseudoclostridium thermosuccinogenes]
MQISLLISMLAVGLICGMSFYILLVPLGSKNLVHCIIMGLTFGLVNYFVSYKIYVRYIFLKDTNNSLKHELKLDKLTGLYNRGAFDNDLPEISSYNYYSLVLIDIDNFRTFNNEFGHKAGDIVLKKVSQTIRANIRFKDAVYRYGGEEIIIVLKDCSKKNAFNIAEKIRTSINQLDNSPYPNIAVSLGVSSCPEDGNEFDEVFDACDKALLLAKKSGKNRAIAYN